MLSPLFFVKLVDYTKINYNETRKYEGFFRRTVSER